MHKIIHFLVVIHVFICSSVIASEAELLWVVRGAEHKISYSKLENDAWKEPEELYKSDNGLTSLALVTDLNGMSYMVWTEQYKTRSVLMMKQRDLGDVEWSKAKQFSDFGQENFAATMVVDLSNRVWLFWSANHGKDDDIYLVTRTKKGWSVPQKVNDKNTVPDLTPQASLNMQGEVIVQWLSYSAEEGTYISLNKVFAVEKPLKSKYKVQPENEVAELSFDKLPSIKFLPENTGALIHFRNNHMLQSQRIRID